MKNLKGCFSHNSDDWSTPSYIYNFFMDKGYIDPCPLKCQVDNLKNKYFKDKLFINPPYSQIDAWVDFALDQVGNDCEVVLLIPARTDTRYFHRLLMSTPLIYFIKGRLKFGNSKFCAPFPSILVWLNKGNALPLYSVMPLIDYEKKS